MSSNRYQIVEDLKDDMLSSIKRVNDYNIEPVDVLSMLPSPEEITQYPIVAFYLVNDRPFSNSISDDVERMLSFVLIGYTDDILDAYLLSEDIEKFLYSSDNRHAQTTELLPEGVTFSTGGVINKIGVAMFDLEFTVFYNTQC